jgi:1-acyl-sn-glycerol-3-phosphate acyltransferase
LSFRALFAVPFIAVLTLVLGVVAILAGLLDWGGRTARAVGRLWARAVLLLLGVRVEVRGAAPGAPGASVYAANHASAIDIPILLAHVPADLRLIHKRSLYLVPVFGWSLFLSGHIGIDRSRPFRARRSLAAAARRLREGASLAAFPEGTRSPDGEVRPFKRGSFVLAMEAGAPVVPVSLAGVKRIVPRGLFSLRPGVVRLTLHPAIPTRGLAPEGAAGLAEEVRGLVSSACREGVA